MVGFRLGGALLERLHAEATARGLSEGQCARALVSHVLQDEARLLLLEEVDALRQQVSRLRDDVATTLELILMNVAKVDEASVRQYVRSHLRNS
jgi:hypothetical protein